MSAEGLQRVHRLDGQQGDGSGPQNEGTRRRVLDGLWNYRPTWTGDSARVEVVGVDARRSRWALPVLLPRSAYRGCAGPPITAREGCGDPSQPGWPLRRCPHRVGAENSGHRGSTTMTQSNSSPLACWAESTAMGASSAALPKPKRGSGSSSRRWGSSASGAIITALRPSSDATDCAYRGNSESGQRCLD